MLTKFLFIRVLIFSVVLAAAAFLIDKNHPEVPVGILVGGFASVYKIRMFTVFLTGLAQNGKKTFIKSIFLTCFSQALSLLILLAAVKVSVYLFFGVAVGLVLTAAVICLNGLTEKMKLTHNNWQFSEKED